MDRDQLVIVLGRLPDTDVRVEIGHTLIDVTAAIYDADRDAIVLRFDPIELRQVVEKASRNMSASRNVRTER